MNSIPLSVSYISHSRFIALSIIITEVKIFLKTQFTVLNVTSWTLARAAEILRAVIF